MLNFTVISWTAEKKMWISFRCKQTNLKKFLHHRRHRLHRCCIAVQRVKSFHIKLKNRSNYGKKSDQQAYFSLFPFLVNFYHEINVYSHVDHSFWALLAGAVCNFHSTSTSSSRKTHSCYMKMMIGRSAVACHHRVGRCSSKWNNAETFIVLWWGWDNLQAATTSYMR